MTTTSLSQPTSALQSPSTAAIFTPPTSTGREIAPPTIRDDWGGAWRLSSVMLGHGAWGTVLLGMNVATGELVAIKMLPLKVSTSSSSLFSSASTSRQAANEIEDSLGVPLNNNNNNISSSSSSSSSQQQQYDSSWIRSLGREVALLAKLHNPSIVGYKSFCVAHGHACIVMEYVSGGSLSKVLESFGALSEQTVRRYVHNIVSGLSYLHRHNVMHGDIKTGNILLDVTGQCKISDFGTSKFLGTGAAAAVAANSSSSSANSSFAASSSTANNVVAAAAAASSSSAPSASASLDSMSLLTSRGLERGTSFGTSQGGQQQQHQQQTGGGGLMIGSPLFMAPEQARGRPCIASDMWSLGLAAIQLATNQLPYDSQVLSLAPIQFLYKLGSDPNFAPVIPPKSVSTSAAAAAVDMSDAMRDFLQKCLCRDASTRLTADLALRHPWLAGTAVTAATAVSESK